MENVNIKHYLNKRLRPDLINNELNYPVYVRVSYGRNNDRFKSEWVIHTCTEFDFNNNQRIKDLIAYECDIIKDIFESVGTQDINLAARLVRSMDSVTEWFIGWVIDEKVIKQQLIDYICKKTGLSESILPYIKRELSPDEWVLLIGKDIFTEDVKQRLLYYTMLLEFEEMTYNRKTEWDDILELGEIFNYYEWKNMQGRDSFLTYAKQRNLLPKSMLLDITNQFDETLINSQSWDLMIEKRKKRE